MLDDEDGDGSTYGGSTGSKRSSRRNKSVETTLMMTSPELPCVFSYSLPAGPATDRNQGCPLAGMWSALEGVAASFHVGYANFCPLFLAAPARCELGGWTHISRARLFYGVTR